MRRLVENNERRGAER
jgi:hypothetical protein